MLAKENIKQFIPQGVFAAVIIAATVLAAYFVVLSSTFGIMDDYTFLHSAMVGSNDMFTLLIGAGRPLNAILLDFGFRASGSIENLAVLRAITLVGIWLLGFGLYLFSRLHSVSYISSLAIACGIVLLPSFQVYASWAQHFTTPFAGALALLSAFILTPACNIRERSRGLAVVLSALLLLISILIYQPIAMLFCTGILISMLSRPDISTSWRLSRLIDAVTAFVTAMFLGLVIFKIGQYLHPMGSSRYGLVHDIPEKLHWFVSEPIANALSLYSVPASATMKFLVALTILLGALSFIRKYRVNVASRIFIYGAFFGLASYAPNLATAENWASYRSIGALSASVVVVLVFMATELFASIQGKFIPVGLVGGTNSTRWLPPSILLIILAMHTQSNVLTGFVLPNVTELNNLASALNEAQGERSEKVSVIIKPSTWAVSAARPMAYDEFGVPSSLRDYYARAIVEIVLRSTNIIPSAIIMATGNVVANESPDHSRSIVVDFSRLVTSQRFKTDPKASLHSSLQAISPLNISDDNWKNGIWSNKNNPSAYSFVYRKNLDEKELKPGDKLDFYKSGVRNVIWVDFADGYTNVLVDGKPLTAEDGFPRAIKRHF